MVSVEIGRTKWLNFSTVMSWLCSIIDLLTFEPFELELVDDDEDEEDEFGEAELEEEDHLL